MNPRPLSNQTCLLLILIFGIAAYANTFNVPFQFDDQGYIANNYFLHPPVNMGRIWQFSPSRFVANMSFAIQYAFTGLAPWGFHCINLLIHLLTSMIIFATTRMLLRTPALQSLLPASQHNLFALGPALLFLTHPIQTQAVTYIVQRMTSLATLFYLTTLWLYLKARLENARHYWLVFIFMLAAMLTKEISFTLPFAILLTDICFFPLSGKETLSKKILRWIPFAAFILVIPLIYVAYPKNLAQSGGAIGILPTVDAQISRWHYLLTQFRVMRTYLRLLVFPIDQKLDYGYSPSSGMGDFDTWSAFALLFAVLMLAVAVFKKHRLLAFGILWFFLTLSVESTLIPLPDFIFEHRLYLPMCGFSIFFVFFLWLLMRSSERFFAVILIISIVLSGMTYARNEVWKSAFTLWQDNIRKSPSCWRPYAILGEAYLKERKDEKTALKYFYKTVEMGYEIPLVLADIAYAYSSLGDHEKSAYYLQRALALQQLTPEFSSGYSFYNQAIALMEEKKTPEAIQNLKEAIQVNPENLSFHILLGELYRQSGQETLAIESFRKAIRAVPFSRKGYDALALFYKEKGENEKALAVLVEYLRFKKKHGPLFGS